MAGTETWVCGDVVKTADLGPDHRTYWVCYGHDRGPWYHDDGVEMHEEPGTYWAKFERLGCLFLDAADEETARCLF